jgi:hypothetical protein
MRCANGAQTISEPSSVDDYWQRYSRLQSNENNVAVFSLVIVKSTWVLDLPDEKVPVSCRGGSPSIHNVRLSTANKVIVLATMIITSVWCTCENAAKSKHP